MKIYVKTKKIKRCMDCDNLWHPVIDPAGFTIPFFYCKKMPRTEELSIDLVRTTVAEDCPLDDIEAVCEFCGRVEVCQQK